MAVKESVYTGFWINWSEGQLKGATLTLTNQHGAYLVAFLAVFVQLAGVFSWQILAYFFFRHKASPRKIDGLNGQHLAILRNVQSDIGTVWELSKASWHKRHSTARPFKRILAILVIASLHGLGFAIAGIFSSRVTSTKSVALLRSDSCGIWHAPLYNRNETDQSLESALWEDKWDTVLAKSANFAATCYNTTTPSSNCNAYGRRLLSLETTTHNTCPFDSSICANKTVVRLGSGYVDSLLDLGINSSPEDRVAFRKVVECAPLRSEGYRKTYTGRDLPQDAVKLVADIDVVEGHSYEAFFYGRNLAQDTEATFISSNRSFRTSAGSFFTPYRMHSETAVPRQLGADSVTNTFAPIPELTRTDAEVVLMFLASQALYTSPVNDPWFEAKAPLGIPGSEARGYQFDVYLPRQSVSVLGCTDQTEVCNPLADGKRNCTAMPVHLFADDLSALGDRLSLTPKQLSILRRFSDVIQNSIDASFAENGDGGLLAGYLADDYTSAAIPDNQWVLELQNWFVIFLTMVQIRVTQYVTGFDNPQFNHFMVPPTAEEKWMCTNQIAQRKDYASFSVLGLAIIICTVLAIMLLNLFLHDIWSRFCSKSGPDQYRLEQWRKLETLELQCAAATSTAKVVGDDESTIWTSQDSSKSRGSSSANSIASSLPWVKQAKEWTDRHQSIDMTRNSSTTATLELNLAQEDFPSSELTCMMVHS